MSAQPELVKVRYVGAVWGAFVHGYPPTDLEVTAAEAAMLVASRAYAYPEPEPEPADPPASNPPSPARRRAGVREEPEPPAGE